MDYITLTPKHLHPLFASTSSTQQIWASFEGKGWTPADELRIGDKIRQADGTTGIVWLKWNIHKTKEMYNLTVDTAHTFFVGEGQWLVHNSCNPLQKILQPNKKLQQGITAIGNYEDTSWVAKNLPEVRTLSNVSPEYWTAKGNIKWLDAAMRRGDEIWLVTDPKIWKTVNPKSKYFLELDYIRKRKYDKVIDMFIK